MLNAVFPAMNAVDAWLANGLPLVVRICFWGVVAGIAAMGIYAALSNQEAILALKQKSKALRRQMLHPSLEKFSAFLNLAKESFKISFSLLGKVMGPVFLATVPVLVIASWLDTFHGYTLPQKSQTVTLTLVPVSADFQIDPPDLLIEHNDGVILIRPPSNSSGPVSFYISSQLVYEGNVFTFPVPALAKKKWWNFIFASETGYLKPGSPLEEIHIHFPDKPVHNSLPGWASGWEWTFFISILIVSLPIKFIFKIH